MESLGAISEGEWGSFSAMYSNEESEFMAQLLNNCPIPNDSNGGTASSFKIPCTANNNYYLSLGSTDYSGSSSYFFPTSSHDQSYDASNSNQILLTNNDSALDYYMVEAQNINLLEGDNFLNQEMISGCSMEEFSGNLPKADIGKETHFLELELSNEVELNKLVQKSKKRCNLEDVEENKRNAKSRKNQKLISTSRNEEQNNAAICRQSSSSYCSEDDSNASHELELNAGVASASDSKGASVLNSNGKTRAIRGSATDPQSIYARKRRERINERLRTLQNLVPNGTKVDISTMLEEAVQYVKFLQLQIKVLSSDDMWMYAPLAYNGMDLGLDLNNSRS